MWFDGIFCKVFIYHQQIRLLVDKINFQWVQVPNLIECQRGFNLIFFWCCFYDTIIMEEFTTIALSSFFAHKYQILG